MAEPNAWWNWNFTTTIVGGLLAGLVGVVLFFIQEYKKDKKENKENLEEDNRNLCEVLDYLNYLEATFKRYSEATYSFPFYIILPFKKEIKFVSCSCEQLQKIRSGYNELVLRIYEMQKVLDMKKDAEKLAQTGLISMLDIHHKQLQEKVLSKARVVKKEIEDFQRTLSER